MKSLLLPFILLIGVACDGRLSDEQRRKMREQMELHKIKKVSETEITEAAFTKGRSIMAVIEKLQNDSIRIDSLNKAYKNAIRYVVPGKSNALLLEQQLVDAYLADPSGQLQDNVQKLRRNGVESDSILYSKPVITKLPDGVDRLDGVWNIWLSKKQLILDMDK